MSQEPDISTVSVLKRERVRFTAFFTSLSVKQDKRETVCPPPLLHCALLQQLCNGLESQSHWREQATHFSSVKKKKKTSHQNTNIVIPGCDNHQTAREAVWLAEQQPHERFPLRGNVRRVYVVLEMFLFLFF